MNIVVKITNELILFFAIYVFLNSRREKNSKSAICIWKMIMGIFYIAVKIFIMVWVYDIGILSGLIWECVMIFIEVIIINFLENSYKEDIFVRALEFVIIYLFTGYLCYEINMFVNPDIFEKDTLIVSMLSREEQYFLILLLIYAVRLIYGQNRQWERKWTYVVDCIVTLVSGSMLILYSMELHSVKNTYLYMMFAAILNFCTYSLHEHISTLSDEKNNMESMKRQIESQQERYNQLSLGYKSQRRILHDVKKHYLMIDSYIAEGQIQKLQEYIKECTTVLEKNI